MGSPPDCPPWNLTPEGSCCRLGGTRTAKLTLLSPSGAAAGRDGGVSCSVLHAVWQVHACMACTTVCTED